MLAVVAGLLLRDRRVLLARRPWHKPHGGLWELPGGKVEPGETVAAALRRELVEELGIVVRASSLWKMVEEQGRGAGIRLWVLWVRTWDGEPASREGQEVAWVDIQTAMDMPLVALDRQLMQELAQGNVLPFAGGSECEPRTGTGTLRS